MKSSHLRKTIAAQKQDWEYTKAGKPDKITFFGKDNQHIYVSQKKIHGQAFYRKRETVQKIFGRSSFNKKYVVQNQSMLRNFHYEKNRSLVSEFQVLVFPVNGITVGEGKFIDVLKLIKAEPKLKGYVPFDAKDIYTYEQQSYLYIKLVKDNDGKDENDGQMADTREYGSSYLNLDTEKLGTEPKVLESFRMDQKETEWDFFSNSNFLEKWQLDISSLYLSRGADEHILLVRYGDREESKIVSDMALFNQNPTFKESFNNNAYTEIHFYDITLEELIAYLIPQDKDPFKDAGEIISSKSLDPITSFDDIKRLYAEE